MRPSRHSHGTVKWTLKLIGAYGGVRNASSPVVTAPVPILLVTGEEQPFTSGA